MQRRRSGWTVFLAGLAAAVAASPGGGARAQNITVDGRLSAARTLAGPNYAIGAELGRQVGGNLFHSFGRFGLNTGETATFSGPASVGNVVGRVTGGAQSSIDGAVRSAIPGANLFLINPAGVVFGPNARVDVSGSFHASSADYLRLRDGARFQATNPDASTLSAAPPEAFGFLSANPRPVQVNGATLQGAPRGTLGLVGGPVTISGGALQAPAGTVHITSAAGPGEVPVDRRAGPAPTVARFERVRVEGGSRIAVSDAAGLGGGGSVYIRAGTLDVAASEIDADNHGPGPGGVVSLRGDGAVTISAGATVNARTRSARGADIGISTAPGGTVTLDRAAVTVGSQGAGSGGRLSVNAGALLLRNGAQVTSYADGGGNGGDVGVGVGGDLVLDGGGSQEPTSIGADSFGSGNAGSVAVSAGNIILRGNAAIFSIVASTGSGGAVTVQAARTLTVDGAGGASAGIQTRSVGDGDAGQLAASAQDIVLRNGVIRSNGASTRNPSSPSDRPVEVGRGAGGDVTVAASGTLTLTDGSLIDGSTAGFTNGGVVFVSAPSVALTDRSSIASTTGSSGRAGDVRIRAGDLALRRGAQIQASSFGSGDAGNVAVDVRGASIIDGGGGSLFTGISSDAFISGSGNAGRIAVRAGSLAILDGGAITSDTSGRGRAGNIAIDAGDLRVAGRDASGSAGGITARTYVSSAFGGDGGNVSVAARSITLRDGGVISGSAIGFGARTAAVNAGEVAVFADTLTIERGARITSTAEGSGRGGSVSVTTTGTLLLDGQDVAGTQIAASAVGAGSGGAGTVSVMASTITVQGGAQIASTTAGPGRGGGVNVAAGSDIRLNGPGPQITATSTGAGEAGFVNVSAPRLSLRDGARITTEAQSANGGNINIGPGDLLYLQNSRITTSVGGASGSGGNITIEPRFVVLDRSVIAANAVGGNGGNVLIAGRFVRSAGSDVTATSQLGVSGEISITGPPLNLNGSLVVLASELRAAAALLRESCAAHGARTPSSLILVGRGGQRQGMAETSLPALYIAHRPVRDGDDRGSQTQAPPARTSVALSSRCG